MARNSGPSPGCSDYRLRVGKLRRRVVCGALLLGMGAAGCGGSAGPARTLVQAQAQVRLAAGAQDPERVVARVAGEPITLAMVTHRIRQAGAGTPLPDPPGYTVCIGRLRELSEGSQTPPRERTPAKLRENCESTYRGLLRQALATLIHDRWISGEAAEIGIGVSEREVREEVESSKKVFRSEAEFRGYVKRAGESAADIEAQARLNRLTDGLFAYIAAKERRVTSAQIARYYAAHRGKYAIPRGRDVRILRTMTEAAAKRVKRELEAGRGFAAVARELSAVGQPIGARDGEVRDLKPGVFEERTLNDAIFGAQLHRLYGPLRLTATHRTIAPETNTGFFLFEVRKVTEGGEVPLSRVKAALARQLEGAQKERIFPPFILAYRREWRARTDCSPGYVVQYCRQFRGLKGQEEVDPYTL